MAMRPPRSARISGPLGNSSSIRVASPCVSGSLKVTEPPVMDPTFGRMPMMAWPMTDLPEPDSPTSAVTLPGWIRKLAPRTASTVVE